MAFIDVEHLSFMYKDNDGKLLPCLCDVSFGIERGEYVAIIGHNGSGKSTLARLVTMIEDYDDLTGKITVDGVEITADSMTDDDVYKLRRKVGMVFQNPDNQLVATVVEEDVAFGPENLGIPREEIRKRVDNALETVGMTEYAKHEPHRLSGGQKQRIAIAGVIAMMPECIIFDESTAMLDPSGRREVLDTIDRLNRDYGITIITITHYMDEAVRAGRVLVLDDGRLIIDGTPAEVFSHKKEMNDAGLELPQCTELVTRLKARGYRIGGDITTPEGCAEAIAKLIKSGNKGRNVKNRA